MKKLIQIKLKILAKMVLAKYKPDVIGITGSIGKTSAKEAIYSVLNKKFNVRRNIKNYNNEIGLPLTIIGCESPGKSIFGWLCVFVKALWLCLWKNENYPEILILEMGVDHPGDMKYLNSIVKPKIGIVTFVGPVHLEYFGSIEKIQKEKGMLIERINKIGWSILNYDNEKTREIRNRSKAKVITYGFDDKADIKAQDVMFSFQDVNNNKSLRGVSFKMKYKGSFMPIFLPKVVGNNAVYAALAGAAVGIIYNMNMVEISEALKELNLPKGRMNLIKGIKNTMIIDDTYNSSPEACFSAIGVLKEIPISDNSKRYAVLGDMLELGSYSEGAHREIGKYLVRMEINKLIVVGEKARDIVRGAEESGMNKENIFKFDSTEVAGRFIQDRIKEGDLLLIKGSQGMRMEKIVKELMAKPLKASELLVRQGKEWN